MRHAGLGNYGFGSYIISNVSEVLNLIYSGSSCWAPLKEKELRGIREECNVLILLAKQMIFFFSFLSLLAKEWITITTFCLETNVC